MDLITGRTGTKHVFARHDAFINQTFLGDGDFVLTAGEELAARRNPEQGATGIDIFDGYLIMQGRLCEIPDGTIDTIILDGGAEGLKRMDLLVAEYTINTETGIENVEIKALKGTPATNTYLRPEVPFEDGIIDDGETHQMVLYEVRIDDYSISSITKAFATLDTLPIQSALDYARSTSNYVKEILNGLVEIIKVYPLVSLDYKNQSVSSGIMRLNKGAYIESNIDKYDLYVNGLRILNSDFTISISETDVVITFTDTSISVNYDEVTLVVWRAE